MTHEDGRFRVVSIEGFNKPRTEALGLIVLERVRFFRLIEIKIVPVGLSQYCESRFTTGFIVTIQRAGSDIRFFHFNRFYSSMHQMWWSTGLVMISKIDNHLQNVCGKIHFPRWHQQQSAHAGNFFPTKLGILFFVPNWKIFKNKIKNLNNLTLVFFFTIGLVEALMARLFLVHNFFCFSYNFI